MDYFRMIGVVALFVVGCGSDEAGGGNGDAPEDLPCGCPVSDQDGWPSYPGCADFSSACEPVKVVDCMALQGETDCFEVGVISDLDALDCVLSSLAAGDAGSYSIRLDEGGFSSMTRTLFVDPQRGAVARECEPVDLSHPCDPTTMGPVDTEGAEACMDIEDPNARLACAWDLFAFSDLVSCE